MKTTKLGLLAFLGLGVFAYGQTGNEPTNGKMGINTTGPRATLDIQVSTDNQSKATNEGVLIPQLTKARAMKISNKVDGTLVYISEDVGAGDTAFIGTGKGFYYWNGSESKWVKLGADVASSASVSAANGLTANGGTVELGGTLTKATTVTQNNNDMTFTTGKNGKTIIDGTFETKGAVYAKVRPHSGDLTPETWGDDDYVIVLSGTSNPIALPDATKNTGRVLSIVNQTGGFRNFVGTAVNKPLNTGNLGGGKGSLYISDGSNWHIFGGY